MRNCTVRCMDKRGSSHEVLGVVRLCGMMRDCAKWCEWCKVVLVVRGFYVRGQLTQRLRCDLTANDSIHGVPYNGYLVPLYDNVPASCRFADK